MKGVSDMEKYIPFEKLSKKKQREQNSAGRGSWYGINPVTRRPESAKAYNRQKAQKWSNDLPSVPFLSFHLIAHPMPPQLIW